MGDALSTVERAEVERGVAGASYRDQLLQRLTTRRARVGLIGLGYAGLPLAVAFAEAGFPVVGVDLSLERVAALQAGRSYVSDIPDRRIASLVERGRFTATADYGALTDVDA